MAAAEILTVLLQINLAAAAAILLVAAVRKPARKLFGAEAAYRLWLAPVLIPVAGLLPARVVFVDRASAGGPAPSIPVGLTDISSLAAAPAYSLLMFAWLAGVAFASVGMAVLQWRFFLEAERGAVGPAVVGLFRPRIVTPRDFAERFSPEEQALVLAHEETHVARRHSGINALAAFAQCVFWFNPLVHMAAHLARIDQEIACDEAVITRFPESRRIYAEALVKAQLAIRPLPVGCYWPSGTEHPLLERLAMLKTHPTRAAQRIAGAWGIGLACAAMAAGAWAAKPADVRLASPKPATRTGLIPEMTPTGEMTPAYGSYPAGTPASHIQATTPVMTPTGVMRPVFDPPAVKTLQPLPPRGEIGDRSVLTNSVIRDEPPKPPATAQRPLPSTVFARMPTAEEFMAAYPARAMRMEQNGRAGVNCLVGGEGVLEDCSVTSESNAGYGFAEAALKLTSAFRANTTNQNGESIVGQRITLPIDFRMK